MLKIPVKKTVSLAETVETDLDEAQPGPTPLSKLGQLADELGVLQPMYDREQKKVKKAMAVMQPYFDKAKELTDELASLDEAGKIGDDVEGAEFGKAHGVKFGVRGKQRNITDMELVKELLGQELFMKLAKVLLKDLDDYMTPEDRAKVIETVRGKRGWELVPAAKK